MLWKCCTQYASKFGRLSTLSRWCSPLFRNFNIPSFVWSAGFPGGLCTKIMIVIEVPTTLRQDPMPPVFSFWLNCTSLRSSESLCLGKLLSMMVNPAFTLSSDPFFSPWLDSKFNFSSFQEKYNKCLNRSEVKLRRGRGKSPQTSSSLVLRQSVSQLSCSVVSDSVTPWTGALQASLFITNSWSLRSYTAVAFYLLQALGTALFWGSWKDHSQSKKAQEKQEDG